MLYPTALRAWDGVDIRGQQIGVTVYPRLEGKLGVSVIAEPSLTGFDRGSRLTSEGTPYFSPSEIVVHDTKLECFAADRTVPFFRCGFVLDIEPGMARELRAWLPKLATVTARAEQAAQLFTVQLERSVVHQHSEIAAVIARVVLDGWTAEKAVAWAKENTASKEDTAFLAQFDTDAVRAVLQ